MQIESINEVSRTIQKVPENCFHLPRQQKKIIYSFRDCFNNNNDNIHIHHQSQRQLETNRRKNSVLQIRNTSSIRVSSIQPVL